MVQPADYNGIENERNDEEQPANHGRVPPQPISSHAAGERRHTDDAEHGEDVFERDVDVRQLEQPEYRQPEQNEEEVPLDGGPESTTDTLQRSAAGYEQL